ncbi:FUSC family protein [Natronincola ferrireducens]|uniref:Uncharacterized membrane protein YgaE, UPF0421/DUF939 family n=1 Tax=Natronincola ferrireducens TaxID=393762 RepID=A0A1G9HPA7_9FIRM|nr:aromatic acid exporter family protein [Natronincola ferrireducens]SDL14712.1 Uncharacterized membrane protein YgaE, UPF0421/DUF939 family [Natronincola ferrireducens]
MKIGLRTIKTGIAVTLSLFVSNLLGIDNPFYAAVAAIIVMQPTVSDSWVTGINRMLGTVIGAVVGAIFVGIAPANPLLAGFGIIVLILIMNRLNWGESIAIAGVVFVGIFLNIEGDHISNALHRLLDTSIGIIIGVIINYTVYPPAYDGKVIDEIKQISKNTLKYNIKALELLLKEEENLELLEEQIQGIEKELKTSEKLLELQKKEEKMKIYCGIKHKEMLIIINLEKEVFQHLQNIQNILEKGIHEDIVNIVKEDIDNIKSSLKKFYEKEKQIGFIHNGNDKDPDNLKPIIQHIKKTKVHLNNYKDINNYPTDEVVKMLVFLYNLEEALLKFNMIICC